MGPPKETAAHSPPAFQSLTRDLGISHSIIVMGYTVMTDIFMAYVVMAYIVMPLPAI